MALNTRKVLAAITLCAFAAGCSSYRSVSLPGTEPVDVGEATPVVEAKTGQSARITLVSGEVITGEVTAVTTDSITVGRPGNYGMKKRTAAASEIARIEVEQSTRATNIVAISVAGVLAVGAFIAASYGAGAVAGLAGSN